MFMEGAKLAAGGRGAGPGASDVAIVRRRFGKNYCSTFRCYLAKFV
jgi:hypothetical protein